MTAKKSHCSELEEAVRGLLDAVLWLSGSSDFASTMAETGIVPGGDFGEGYGRIVQPAIRKGFEVLRD